MATITAFTTTKRPRGKWTITSDPATVATSDTVELSGLPTDLPGVFLSVRFFDGGGSPVLATLGQFDIEIQTEGTDPVFEKPGNSTIQALSPTTVSWVANTEAIKVTSTALAGPTTWRVVLIFNG